MLPKPQRNSQTLTGSIEPVSFKDLVSRTQAIRFRAKTPHHKNNQNQSSKNTANRT